MVGLSKILNLAISLKDLTKPRRKSGGGRGLEREVSTKSEDDDRCREGFVGFVLSIKERGMKREKQSYEVFTFDGGEFGSVLVPFIGAVSIWFYTCIYI